MTARPVIRLRLADADIAAAVAYYRREAGVDVGARFIDALEQAIELIATAPATGSPRLAEQLGLPGLRSRHLAGFPYLVFYREDAGQITVWRILHERRDIAASLQEPGA